MKLRIVVVVLLNFAIGLEADSGSLDAQIERIKHAPESERYLLVNELKKKIAKLNTLQQAREIAKYQEESLRQRQYVDFANNIQILDQIHKQQNHQIIVPPIEAKEKGVLPTSKPSESPILPEKNTPSIPITPTGKEKVVPTYKEVEPPQPVVPVKPTYKEVVPTKPATTPTYKKVAPVSTPSRPTIGRGAF